MKRSLVAGSFSTALLFALSGFVPATSHGQNPFAPAAPTATATGTAPAPAAAPSVTPTTPAPAAPAPAPTDPNAPTPASPAPTTPAPAVPAPSAPAATDPNAPTIPAPTVPAAPAPAATTTPLTAPTTPAPTAPTIPDPNAPTTPAPLAPAAPSTPAANPFGTPAPTTPTAPTPAAPAANPFGAPTIPAPTTPAPSAPAANPFGTPAPTAPATPAPATPAAPAAPSAPSAATVPVQEGPPPSGGYRKLAPGVETTIPSPVSAADRTSRHDVVELLATVPEYGVRPWAPGVAPAKAAHFKHDVWGLDFTFKPVRFLRVASADGQEHLIWYMIYHVKNNGEKPFLFIPRFELQSHDVQQTYSERILPGVVPLIREREDKNRRLLSTAEITGEIPPSTPDADKSVWGVVTWEGVDPRTDRFTIFVHGLTNAYQWEDPPGAYKPGDPPGTGRIYRQQVLKMNFWRPSDTRFEHEDEIRFGIPGDVDYAWLYQ